jgi:hypothetical protein
MEQSELVKKLPDCYEKKADSNNNKILSLNEQAIKQLKENIKLANEYLDLSKAKGKTLDLYGEMYNQKRGGLDDAQYRYMILTKIARNSVGANYQNVLNHIIKMFNCNQGDVELEDVEIAESGDCTVKLTKMPISVLVGAGFTSKQAVAMIEMLLPTCINLEADEFEGTFCFSDRDDEYDENAGFADDDQTTGGYFGLLLGEDEEIPLPV